ncbi:MAG: hypothetical protein K2M91_08845, partial [Lachnospiraceae bacterium]|nr:hypothetical protein [Lachnospiraceae bacterium]
VMAEYERAMGTFEDAPKDNQEFLKLFSFICFLSFDVYMKKQLIETLIDEMKKDNFKATEKDNKQKQTEK